uniref:VPS37 C-terminal domain-containing protein n=1 Tax=Gopherus agassizii TaxID=38772 RepID=A0A452GRN8_9SAUR
MLSSSAASESRSLCHHLALLLLVLCHRECQVRAAARRGGRQAGRPHAADSSMERIVLQGSGSGIPGTWAQVEMFLGRELPLDAFLEFFQESRMLSHLRRTQVEKLEQLLRKEKQPRWLPTSSPKKLQLRYGYTPALLSPLPCSSIPCLGSPLRLIGHIPLLTPRPFRQEPPHR